jgi:transcriptional regulator with XRE-family HTH domain
VVNKFFKTGQYTCFRAIGRPQNDKEGRGRMKKPLLKFGDYLFERRVYSGLTLTKLSEDSGIPVRYLGLVEQGKTGVNIDVLQKLSGPLDVSLLHMAVAAGIIPYDDLDTTVQLLIQKFEKLEQILHDTLQYALRLQNEAQVTRINGEGESENGNT